jgi:hypothetical protein
MITLWDSFIFIISFHSFLLLYSFIFLKRMKYLLNFSLKNLKYSVYAYWNVNIIGVTKIDLYRLKFLIYFFHFLLINV